MEENLNTTSPPGKKNKTEKKTEAPGYVQPNKGLKTVRASRCLEFTSEISMLYTEI